MPYSPIITQETPLAPDSNFPTGYSNQTFRQAFDFTRDLFYQPISDNTNGGIAITNLSTMAVTRTVTLAQMYAGTSYGHPAGSPPSQTIYDVAAGNGTDLYMLMDNGIGGVAGEFCRFTRVDAVSMKVTGEFYSSNTLPPPINSVVGNLGVVNTTATHTVVAYVSNGGLGKGPQILDGTGMAPIGMGPVPSYGTSNNVLVIAGARHTDHSCDFLMLNSDYNHPSGNVDIWRINVSDGLAITSTKTGTVNILPLFTPPNLYIAQADYDTAHDAIILQLTNSGTPTGPPIWVMSVTFGGTINWTRAFSGDLGIPYGKGASQLTGTTLMVGGGSDLKLIDTGAGTVTFAGAVSDVSGSYYRVYDAARMAYWTYALGTFGFTRITLTLVTPPPRVLCATTWTLDTIPVYP